VRRWRHKARSRWLREATKLARCYQPLGKLQDNLALQTEFAKKAFKIAVKGAEDSAKTARQSTGKVVKIIQDRLKESLNEIRSGLDRSKSA
jgi:hypothetical protein